MIREISEKAYAEMLANGDVENAYAFSKWAGIVSLIADMEKIGADIDTRIETMHFDIPREWSAERVAVAAADIRGYYAGGIYIEPYESTDEAVSDFMQLYDGLLYRYYLISPKTTIGEISRLPDGIAYVYIEKEEAE